MSPPQTGNDWFAIEDPSQDTTWLFDSTFLLSGYRCIYGEGCRSIDVEPDPSGTLGCCVHGAHFVDKEDRKSVEAQIKRLTADDWQFKAEAERRGGPLKRKKSGDWVTRKIAGACIFLNRTDFGGGEGCALHRAALRHGERPLDWKPDVCWQVPIHLDIHTDEYGHETVFVRAWKRRDWGPGGEEFNWWCIDDQHAYVAPNPLYETSRDELMEMVGDGVYRALAAELDRRRAETPVALA